MRERLVARALPREALMNKTEAAYALQLGIRQRLGEIAEFSFEAVKLRLAATTFYTPDFLVILPNREIEMHEVKGFWQDDARVKIKVAARLFPFRFIAIRKLPAKDGGGWEYEVIKQ
jgi:hypothetical protein